MNIDPQKTKLAKEYKHSRPLTACHWSPASRFLFFGAEDNLVHRYELASGKTISLEAHDSWVRGFASSPDGKTLYSSSYDGKLGFWPADAEKPEPIRMIDAHAGWVRAVAVSPDGKLAATCGNDLLVKLWETSSGKLVKTFAGHKRHVYNVAFSQDSTAVFSCDLMGVVHRWTMDADKPQELVTVKALHKYDKTFRADIGGARGIALRDDGQQLALGGITNVSNAFAGVGEVAVALVNLTGEKKLERVLQSKGKTRGAAWGIAYHPAGYWIGLSGGSGGWLWFWKGDQDHEVFKMKLKSDARGMSLSPDQTQLAAAHADSHLRIYSLAKA